MTWSYRVLRTSDTAGEVVYRIHEVYYGDDGSIDCWTVDPVEPLGESLSELREDIRYFLAAFRKPVLEEAEEGGKPVLRPADDEQEINEGHYFELMDRASVALDHCYQFVGSHPVTRRHEALRELYEKAEEALYRVYQEAARWSSIEARTDRGGPSGRRKHGRDQAGSRVSRSSFARKIRGLASTTHRLIRPGPARPPPLPRLQGRTD